MQRAPEVLQKRWYFQLAQSQRRRQADFPSEPLIDSGQINTRDIYRSDLNEITGVGNERRLSNAVVIN